MWSSPTVLSVYSATAMSDAITLPVLDWQCSKCQAQSGTEPKTALYPHPTVFLVRLGGLRYSLGTGLSACNQLKECGHVPTVEIDREGTLKSADACRRPRGKNSIETPYTVEDRGTGGLTPSSEIFDF